MTSEVTLPVWSVVLFGLFAAIGLLDRLLIPSVRWAMRRRANRAIEELNTRLRLQIQPFKLTRRQVLIDRLLYDPEVLSAVESYSRETGAPREVAMTRAQGYAREIVPSFSAYTYFKVGTRLARRISQGLYRVRLGYTSNEAMAAIDPNSAVVFVINHRSNMDYVLVTYLASTSSALSYAVGEWAQVWGLRSLIRSMGAYFIRRDSRDALYRRVLSRYVQMATAAGVTQAMFPEGGLTRDGALRGPKLGLLSYMVSSFDPKGERDVVFIPVGLNYDRVLEDRIQIAAATTPAGERPRFKFNPFVLTGFLLKSLGQRLAGRWHRYGYACVSFGAPVSLKTYLANRGLDFRTLPPDIRTAEIERLGTRLMTEVGQVVPALPVPLVASVMLAAGNEALTEFEVKGRVYDLMRTLERKGAYVHIPRADRNYAIDLGLKALAERHMIEDTNGTYRANPEQHALLTYYANSIAHLIDPVGAGAPAGAGTATPAPQVRPEAP